MDKLTEQMIARDSAIEHDAEIWRPIRTDEKLLRAVGYEASNFGRVRVVWKSRPPHIQSTHNRMKRSGAVDTVFTKIHGKDQIVARLVWEAFRGKIPPGMCIVHRNGLKTDNALRNLQLMSRGECCEKFSKFSRPRRVVRIDRNGEIIDAYPSARAAAREYGFCSDQYITQRCNGRISPENYWMPDGTSFRWEDGRIPTYIKEAMRHEQGETEEDR